MNGLYTDIEVQSLTNKWFSMEGANGNATRYRARMFRAYSL